MQHKEASANRFAALIVVAVVALNLYWAVSLFMGQSQVNPGFVLAGLAIQAVAIAGLLHRLPQAVQCRVPGVLFALAVIFGASVEWFGLFLGNERGRVSPSIWAPSK
jgi:hypothetical protein